MRQLSNRGNKLGMVFSVMIFIVSFHNDLTSKNNEMTLLFDTLRFLYDNRNVISFVRIISASAFLLYLNNYWYTKLKNRELANLPYEFDFQKEFWTHKIVGNPNARLKNGAVYMQTYTEWKNYIEKTYESLKGNDDFYGFVRQKLRECELYTNTFTAILIPAEIAILTLLSGLNNATDREFISNFVALVVVMVAVTVVLKALDFSKNANIEVLVNALFYVTNAFAMFSTTKALIHKS